MKSILLSIKPKWLAKILNGEKTIEVRKKFPKDYVGWVYIYCTKEDSLCCIKRIDRDRYICGKEFDLRDFPYLSSRYEGKGKVVARFWCDKVEDLIVSEDSCGDAILEVGWGLIEQTCLTEEQICRYIGKYNTGYAIHISKLEIFDRPRELDEFKKVGYLDKIKPIKVNPNLKDAYKSFEPIYNRQIEKEYTLTKAPQNYCYVEGE